MAIVYIIVFAVSIFVLLKSGSVVIKYLSRIARFLHWSEFITAFVVMAFTTSLPELFVGLSAAFHQRPVLSFGNIIGANLINLTLVVAIAVLLGKNLKTKGRATQRSAIYTAVIAALPILLILDSKLSRLDGVILLLALLIYFHGLGSRQGRFSKTFRNQQTSEERMALLKNFLKNVAFFCLAVFFLILSAEGIVWSSSALALGLGMSLFAVGVIIVALGTTLPEIIFSAQSAKKGHKEMALGNVMGSVVVNSSLILGLTVFISPLQVVSLSPYVLSALFTIVVAVIFFIFSKTGRQISRKEGVLLLFIYLAFIACQFIF